VQPLLGASDYRRLRLSGPSIARATVYYIYPLLVLSFRTEMTPEKVYCQGQFLETLAAVCFDWKFEFKSPNCVTADCKGQVTQAASSALDSSN